MANSGKFVLRVGEALHRELKGQAEHRGLSLNGLCVERLANTQNSPHLDYLNLIPFQTIGLLQYGSSQRGERTAQSDVDWLVVLDPAEKLERQTYHQLDRIDTPHPKISVSLSHLPNCDEKASNFWLELALEAQVLWEKSGAVTLRLIEIRRAIASGSYQRFETHGQPYWVHRGEDEKSKIG